MLRDRDRRIVRGAIARPKMNGIAIEKQPAALAGQIVYILARDLQPRRFVIYQDPIRLAVRFVKRSVRKIRGIDRRERVKIRFRMRLRDQIQITVQHRVLIEHQILEAVGRHTPDALRQILLERDRQSSVVDRRQIRIQHDLLFDRCGEQQREDPRPEHRADQRPQHISMPVSKNALNHRHAPRKRR